MPLHPEVLALEHPFVYLGDVHLDDARAATIAATPGEAGPGVAVRQVDDLAAGGVPCRLYRPADGPLPVVVFTHGGGWVDGNLDTHDAVCRLLAARSGLAVLAVDYRLAPEHPAPAAFCDVDAVVQWVHDAPARTLGLDASRLAFCGDSSGGHLAAVAAHRTRQLGIGVAAQALFYPVMDPSGARWGDVDNPGLKQLNMRWFWDAFVPSGTLLTSADIDPREGDLSLLPPTLVITAEHDILTAEGEDYAARVAAAGVTSVTFEARGQIHGFVRRLARFSAAEPAITLAAGFLSGHLAG